VPRGRPDGGRNPMLLQRLKSKLGNRSNASSEVEFAGATGWLLGEPGRGVATIIEMVRHTRLDCALGSAGNMRHAVAEAIHHCTQRRAFGALLIEQPLMQNVLADLALESEAATMLAVRVARAFDEAAGSEPAQRLVRILTPLAKYWICKRAPAVAGEALECLGGNGYVEDSPMPRIYRDAPVNSVWEGSGNVQCLDLLRALAREPATLAALFDELTAVRGADQRLDRFVADLQQETHVLEWLESRARRLVEGLTLAVQGALMVQHAPPAVAEGFLASRIAADRGLAFGTLPPDINARAIVERARPVV
jgi:putative acyl-CoA dehydrogenase